MASTGGGRAEYRCVCELDARTRPSYSHESAQLLAAADADAWATAVLTLKIFVGLFVPAVILMVHRAHRLVHKLQQGDESLTVDAPVSTDAPGHKALHQMRLADLHYSLQRLRTSSLVCVVGLMLLFGSWVPMICHSVRRSWPASSLGPYTNYLPLATVGGHTLGLAVHPTNAAAIRMMSRVFILLWLGLSAACACAAASYVAESGRDQGPKKLMWVLISLLCGSCAVAALDGMRRYDRTPRLLLLRIWAIGRFCSCSGGVLMGLVFATLVSRDPIHLSQDPYMPGFLATIVTQLCLPLAATPTVRNQVRKRIGGSRWGGGGVSSGQGDADRGDLYALAASLFKLHPSRSSPDECLQHARDSFTCCTMGANRGPTPTQAQTVASLCSTPHKATFGSVDAFVSHSRHDDEARKWSGMQRWVQSFEEQHQRKPTVWYDRVCIDGDDAASTESIAALPLYVTGCKQLVVLMGPTFTSRLWAMVEVIVFSWSHGAVRCTRPA